MQGKYKIGQKVRFEFKDNETRVGIIKKIKKDLFSNEYLVIVEYPSALLNISANTYFYWLKEDKIIEAVVPGYKGCY